MNVFLHKHITSAHKLGVLIAYYRETIGVFIHGRVLRTVHETDNRLTVSIPKTVGLIDRFHDTSQFLVYNGGELKAQSHLLTADVEQ